MATLHLVKKDSTQVSNTTKPPHISTVASAQPAQAATQVETKPGTAVATITPEEQAQAITDATALLKAHSQAAEEAAAAWTTNTNIIELLPFVACLCREVDFEEALATPYSQIYVKVAGGYLKHMKLQGGRHIRLPVDKLPGKIKDPFPDHKAMTEEINFLPAGKIPFEFYNQIVQFFRAVMRLKKSDMEAHAWILWEEEKGYYISIPKQKVGKASVEFTYDEDALPKGAIIVVDIHSHNTMGAFYSGTDNNNDKTGVYYSGVVGKLTEKSYEWVMRFNHFEQKKSVPDLSEIFDMTSSLPEVPEAWLDKVTLASESRYTPPSMGFGTYFPKGGNTTQDVSRMGKGSEKSSSGPNGSRNFSPISTDSSLWDDLHRDDSFDQFFGERPSGRTLMPTAKANSEFPALGEKFADWQKRQEKNADRDLIDEEFDRAQMQAELQARHGDNRANYYSILQELAELNGGVPEGGKLTVEQEARSEDLEARLMQCVMKMSDKERQELNLSEQAEAFLERYSSEQSAPNGETLDQQERRKDNSNWPYSAVSEAYALDHEDIILGKGSIFSDSSTEEGGVDHEEHMSAEDRLMVGMMTGVDAENCDFPDGESFDVVAAEHGPETANNYAIIDMLIPDMEGYDKGLLEIMKTCYHMLGEDAQASIHMNGIG